MKNRVINILASFPSDKEGAEASLQELFSECREDFPKLKSALHVLPSLLTGAENGNRAGAVSMATAALHACKEHPALINGLVRDLLVVFPPVRIRSETVFHPLAKTMIQSCETGMAALKDKRDDYYSLMNFALREKRDLLLGCMGKPRPPRNGHHTGGRFFRRGPEQLVLVAT